MPTPRKCGGDSGVRCADFDTIIMTPSPVRTPTAGHDRKFLSLPVRTAFLVGVIFGVLTWELWQAATGWGGVMGTGPNTVRTVISSWQITDRSVDRTPPEAFLCDMSDERSDVCRMIGDVRIDVVNRKIVLVATQPSTVRGSVVIKPHPLKQSSEYYAGPVTMARDKVQEHIHALARQTAMNSMVAPVTLTSTFARNVTALECTHRHAAPAVVFSVGGYNGNGYHTFCDGLVPLFISTQHYKGEVVFGVLDYLGWWEIKYGRIVSALSKYPVLPIGPTENKGSEEVDENREPEVHCFSDVTVGLKLHRPNLCVDPEQMPDGADNHAFVQLAARAYGLPVPEPRVPGPGGSLVLGILHREKTRRLLNEAEVIEEASKMGFELRLLSESLLENLDNAKAMAATQELDALLGVHGAGLSQMTMMRKGTVLIQLVPIGAEWVSESDFGECARQNGMHYIAYNVSKEESSLVRKYDGSHAAFTDPTSVWAKGWEEGSEVFLKQDINLDKNSIRRILEETKRYLSGQ